MMHYPRKYFGNRNGNALILVVGILVILVLVATAFITKTQSGRITAAAQRIAAARNDSARVIGNSIADEIAKSLFVRPLIPTTTNPQSANSRRGHPGTNWPRWGQDFNAPYNFAPYAVVPWTNPPDSDHLNGDGIFDDNTDSYNPYGGPSFGDTRWLRDTEPGRADLFDQVNQVINQFQLNVQFGGYDGTPDIFTHWQHLTNLSRSGNAWRIVFDISDVTNVVNVNNIGIGLLEDLDIPVEQWPPLRPTRRTDFELLVHEGTGFPTINFDGTPADNDTAIDLVNYSNTANAIEFWSRWESWFTLNFTFNVSTPDWSLAQSNQTLLPPNFLDLSNLDGDLYPLEQGERAIDAFTPGTARWHVERILTDTDGDGFTDAFWHLSPFSPGPGLRQVVGISITDNSALLNANVATRFHRKDYYGTDSYTSSDLHGEATRGQTPADIALVAANENGFGNWRVGFLDSFANLPGNSNFDNNTWVRYPKLGQPANDRVLVDWDFDQWQSQQNASLLDELGVEVDGDTPNYVFTTANLNPTGDINSRYGRMWYWQLAGRQPFDATNGLRPFTLADELELRIANGNNYQFVGSRFERSLNNIGGNTDHQFLRSSMNDAHEAGEMRDQLDNRQLLFDNRRKLTLFSGARNDLLPPWLRWDERFWQRYDPDDSEDPLFDPPEGYYGYNVQDINKYQQGVDYFYFSQIFPLKVFLEVANAGNDDMPNAIKIARNLAKRWREHASRKVDLREYYADTSFGDPWWESDKDALLTLAERAPLQLMLAMTNGQESGAGSIWDAGVPAQAASGNYDSGDPNDPLNTDEIGDTDFSNIKTNSYMQTRLMAAGLASNILAYRDEDDRWRQHSLFPFHYFNNGEDEATDVPRVLSDTPLSAAITPPVIGRQGNDNDPLTGLPIPYASVPLKGPNGDNIRMLGLEAQPFILEVFIAHVHKADEWGDTTTRFRLLPEDSDVDADGVLDCPQETVAVVQLANPFDREIDLTSYEVEFFGQLYPLAALPIPTLAPGTPNNPTTLILYSINPDSLIFKTDGDTAEFQREWIDFFDIEPKNHPANTRLVEVGLDPSSIDSHPEYWRYDRAYYDALKAGDQNSVALYRWDVDFTDVVRDQFVLVDRLDAPDTLGPTSEPFASLSTFDYRVVEEMAIEWNNMTSLGGDQNQFYYVEKRMQPTPSAGDSLIYVQWDRATRAWGVDVPKYPENGGWHNEIYDPHERNPRYVFAAKDFTRTIDAGNGEEIMSTEGTPDDPSDDVTVNSLKYLTLFNWSTSLDPDDADLDGDTDGDGISEGSLDGSDADLLADNPDPWFTVEVWSPRAGALRPDLTLPDDEGKVVGGLRQRKPTYFDMNHFEDPNNVLIDANGNKVQPRHTWSFPDKGWYGQTVNTDDPNAPDDSDGTTSNDPAFSDNNGDMWITGDEWYMAQPFPMQMLQKDDDFEQVGELLNCWLFGHMLEGTYDLLGPSPDFNGDELVLPISHLHIDPLTGEFGKAINAGTVTTFSEFMYPAIVDANNDGEFDDVDGDGRPDYNWWKPLVSITNPNQAYEDILFLDERVNRLRFMPGIDGLPQMLDGRADSNAAINHPWPRLSIAARVLDSFVCDGPGRPDITGDGIGDDLNPSSPDVGVWPSVHSFYNANNYSGKSTPGLININTAPLEVLRSLPHMYKTVHKTHEDDIGVWIDQYQDQDYDYNTRTLLPESIIQWRERLNGIISHTRGTGVTGGPNYQWRSGAIGLDDDTGPDSVRGFSSPGEVGMLIQRGNSFTVFNEFVGVQEPWNVPNSHSAMQYPEAWQSSFAAQDPFVIPHPDDVLDPLLVLESMGAHLSTDVNETTFSYAPPYNDTEGFRGTTAYEYYGLYSTIVGDGVSGDSEELNLLQSGISNLITTTSDMFTVHMRIRTFTRNSITGVWDATDLDNIIDDSRYVMLVDRSEVNTPAHKPKILYFEKLPN